MLTMNMRGMFWNEVSNYINNDENLSQIVRIAGNEDHYRFVFVEGGFALPFTVELNCAFDNPGDNVSIPKVWVLFEAQNAMYLDQVRELLLPLENQTVDDYGILVNTIGPLNDDTRSKLVIRRRRGNERLNFVTEARLLVELLSMVLERLPR